MARLAVLIALLALTAFQLYPVCEPGVSFRFKGTDYCLQHPMRKGRYTFTQTSLSNAQLDTMSNRYLVAHQYVEIIRQDDRKSPHHGIALGFEFDEFNADYPYFPAKAAIQIKNFSWGGVEFDTTDTLNFTGVFDDVSEDISIEIDSFYNDTICGKFSGLLLSGAGPMSAVENGYFKVCLLRVE